MRAIALFSLLAVLSGCGAAPPAAEAPPSPVAASRAVAPGSAAHVPVEIPVLSDEREVWDCPKCDMVYDRAGMCTMCDADLVHSRVDYSCPVDSKPVEKAGLCPRCPQAATIAMTPLTAGVLKPGAP